MGLELSAYYQTFLPANIVVIQRCLDGFIYNMVVTNLAQARQCVREIESFLALEDRLAITRCLRVIEPAHVVAEAVKLLELWRRQVETSSAHRLIEELGGL
ncbi:MAG TPA: hypothetical protein VKZ59_15465 [Acidobacteriota bacterium]|nr:hypothetical protein [Acidobacteriota bacterium]